MSFPDIVIEGECEAQLKDPEQVMKQMKYLLQVMKATDAGYDAKLKSPSGLSGGDAAKLETFYRSGSGALSGLTARAACRAIRFSESNACMKRIVAAPTAGSCGVLPSVILSYEEMFHPQEEQLVRALFVAGGIGNVIAENASISGAEGGCQAEIGSASAMAAGALTYLRCEQERAQAAPENTNTTEQKKDAASTIPEITDDKSLSARYEKDDDSRHPGKRTLNGQNLQNQNNEGISGIPAQGIDNEDCTQEARRISTAVIFALANMLGLTCDPVGGLVEIPCVRRNASGAVNAILASDLAMAGITSFLSADDVIDSMRRTGQAMARELKETGLGGLAASEGGRRLCEQISRKAQSA